MCGKDTSMCSTEHSVYVAVNTGQLFSCSWEPTDKLPPEEGESSCGGKTLKRK